MIKVLVCDGDGTLSLSNPSSQVKQLLQALPGLGIQLAVASNAPNRLTVENRFQRAGLPIPNVIVTRAEIGTPKPSPDFIYRIRAETGANLNEIVYIGDDDKTDAFCAINAKVLPFTAHYSTSGKPMDYGLPVPSVEALLDYLSTYAHQSPPYFGWNFNGDCSDTKTNISIYALFGQHGDLGLTRPLTRLLKNREDVVVGVKNNHLGSILFHYAVSQTYLSGLIQEIDTVTVYPGHNINSLNPVLATFSADFPKFFKQKQMPQLLVRHTDSADSRLTPGAKRDIYEQFRTIHVNPEYERTIREKSILVLDDFTTSGCSFETARRMLLQAGARRVVGLAIAKWGMDYTVTRISRGWNPFEPCDLDKSEITTFRLNGSLNNQADEYFHEKIWLIYCQ